MKRHRVIAIDGPAGSGKSSTAKHLAEKIGFIYMDTGAMYRSVALAAVKKGIDTNDQDAVGKIADLIEIDMIPDDDGYKFLLNKEDVSMAIREPLIDRLSSLVSSYKVVREKMVDLQRRFALKGDVVAEGRDMGTVVFPHADLKIFLVADLETRAIRRCRQMENSGIQISLDEQVASLSSRDLFDSSRTHSPLKKADDAVEIDTTDMSLNGQVEKVFQLALDKLGLE